MKKILLLTLFLIGISTISYSQSGKGSEKSGGLFSRIFHREKKPRGQMKHFGKEKKDPHMKHNGTAASNNKKRKYKVDGDGFGTATQKKRRGKKSGIK